MIARRCQTQPWPRKNAPGFAGLLDTKGSAGECVIYRRLIGTFRRRKRRPILLDQRVERPFFLLNQFFELWLYWLKGIKLLLG